MMNDVQVGVVGASGYSGAELLKLLAQHPYACITRLFGNTSVGKRIDELHPSLRNVMSHTVEEFAVARAAECDVVFVALPSGNSMKVIPALLEQGCRVIDLGGDFRLADLNDFTRYYGHEHSAPELLKEAVYGLTEWNAPAITTARLIANPGCYPTSILLGLLPLLRHGLSEPERIAVTSYSGTSGAGKAVNEGMMFTEVNESVRAYKVGTHQHIPEIRRFLREFGGTETAFSFVPHLLPASRGIYTTMHVQLRSGVTVEKVAEAYDDAYSQHPFVRIVAPSIPEIKNVAYSNFCDIGFAMNGDTLVIFSAIDNLGKGAAGQALQNMNLMTGVPQTEGLLPCYKKN